MTRRRVRHIIGSTFFLLSAALVVFGGIWMAVREHDYSILRILAILAALYLVLILIGLLSGRYRKAIQSLRGDHKLESNFVTAVDVGNFRFLYSVYEKGSTTSPFNKSYVSMMVGVPFPQDDQVEGEAIRKDLQEIIDDLSGRGVLTDFNPVSGPGANVREGADAGGDGSSEKGADGGDVAGAEVEKKEKVEKGSEVETMETMEEVEKEEKEEKGEKGEKGEKVEWIGMPFGIEIGTKDATAALLKEIQGRIVAIIDKYGLQEMEYCTISGEENGTGYRHYKGNMFDNAVFIAGSSRFKSAYKTAANMYLTDNESRFDLDRYHQLYESIPEPEGHYSVETLEDDVKEMFRHRSSKEVALRIEYEKNGFAVNITIPGLRAASTYHVVPSTGYWWVYAHGRLDNIDPISTTDESFACELLLRIISKYSQG